MSSAGTQPKVICQPATIFVSAIRQDLLTAVEHTCEIMIGTRTFARDHADSGIDRNTDSSNLF